MDQFLLFERTKMRWIAVIQVFVWKIHFILAFADRILNFSISRFSIVEILSTILYIVFFHFFEFAFALGRIDMKVLFQVDFGICEDINLARGFFYFVLKLLN